jgi:hypothetical protein
MYTNYYIAAIISIGLLLVFTASNVVGSWIIPAFSQQTTGAICPAKNIQHWEKIDFAILSPDVAKKLNVTANTDLNVNVLENSNSVEDMKQKVIDFFQGKANLADKSAIQILGTNYALICAQ